MKKSALSGRQKVQKLTTAAVLAALSLVLMFTIRMPLFTPFYELEFSDFPLLLCIMLLGPAYGISSLFIVCIVQALTVSAQSGYIGFIMHFFASGAFLLLVWLIGKKGSFKNALLGTVCGAAAMTAVMIPMNLWLTSVFMQLPVSAFIKGYLGVCILFNLIKAGANGALFLIFQKVLLAQYNKLFNRG